MSEHKVTLRWERGGAEFSYQKYPRDHTWSFDGGHTMTATAAPAYLGNPANVDPEEAFVASLSSCHMLTFLAIACRQKFVLDSYEDQAVGHMEKNAEGKMAITRVELRPKCGVGIEGPTRKSSTRCTTQLTRIASLPIQSRPT
jgi:organic hydroperoxide reductase OsmC/OhrA